MGDEKKEKKPKKKKEKKPKEKKEKQPKEKKEKKLKDKKKKKDIDKTSLESDSTDTSLNIDKADQIEEPNIEHDPEFTLETEPGMLPDVSIDIETPSMPV